MYRESRFMVSTSAATSRKILERTKLQLFPRVLQGVAEGEFRGNSVMRLLRDALIRGVVSHRSRSGSGSSQGLRGHRLCAIQTDCIIGPLNTLDSSVSTGSPHSLNDSLLPWNSRFDVPRRLPRVDFVTDRTQFGGKFVHRLFFSEGPDFAEKLRDVVWLVACAVSRFDDLCGRNHRQQVRYRSATTTSRSASSVKSVPSKLP